MQVNCLDLPASAPDSAAHTAVTEKGAVCKKEEKAPKSPMFHVPFRVIGWHEDSLKELRERFVRIIRCDEVTTINRCYPPGHCKAHSEIKDIDSLAFAVTESREELARELHHSETDSLITVQGRPLIFHVLYCGLEEVAKFLLTRCSASYRTYIEETFAAKDLAMVEPHSRLSTDSACLVEDLVKAIRKGEPETIRKLIDRGLGTDRISVGELNKSSALQGARCLCTGEMLVGIALHYEDYDTAQLLIDRGCEANEEVICQSIFPHALRRLDTKGIIFCLSNGANVRVYVGIEMSLPITYLLNYGDEDVYQDNGPTMAAIKTLIEHGENFNMEEWEDQDRDDLFMHFPKMTRALLWHTPKFVEAARFLVKHGCRGELLVILNQFTQSIAVDRMTTEEIRERTREHVERTINLRQWSGGKGSLKRKACEAVADLFSHSKDPEKAFQLSELCHIAGLKTD